MQETASGELGRPGGRQDQPPFFDLHNTQRDRGIIVPVFLRAGKSGTLLAHIMCQNRSKQGIEVVATKNKKRWKGLKFQRFEVVSRRGFEPPTPALGELERVPKFQYLQRFWHTFWHIRPSESRYFRAVLCCFLRSDLSRYASDQPPYRSDQSLHECICWQSS